VASPTRGEVEKFNVYPLEIHEKTMPKNPSLENLKDQIQEAKKKLKLTPSEKKDTQQPVGKFFNVGVELVSGVFIGVGVGLLFDWIFGTSPWGLIVFFILGSIAGMLNVYKALESRFKRKKN
jgi:ATP synthase protein I